jgi:septum formation protein
VPSAIEEVSSGPPEEQVLTRARNKAQDVANRHAGVIVAADTVVVLDGKILGKPRSQAEARQMLRSMSNREHTVLTGLCVLSTKTKGHRQAVEKTTVCFRALSDEEIDAYLDTGEYEDKAGAYAIQGRAAVFVERICGDYFNVVGLPICRLHLLLTEMGIKA